MAFKRRVLWFLVPQIESDPNGSILILKFSIKRNLGSLSARFNDPAPLYIRNSIPNSWSWIENGEVTQIQ